MAYLKQLLIGVDQLANTLLNGYADETLSARSYRLRGEGWHHAYSLINGIFFWQVDHCKTAFLSELERRQLPAEYRQS